MDPRTVPFLLAIPAFATIFVLDVTGMTVESRLAEVISQVVQLATNRRLTLVRQPQAL